MDKKDQKPRELIFQVWTGSNMMQPKSIQHLHQEILSGITVGQHNAWVYRQYIGRKDKNGRIIFDGDIVAAPYTDKAVSNSKKTAIRNCIVEFSPYSTEFIKTIINSNRHSAYRFIPKWEECIVIGNIYQNPELLIIPEKPTTNEHS